MTPTNPLEEQLNDFGQELRRRPSLVEDVERQLRIEHAAVPLARGDSPRDSRRRRYFRLALSASLTVAVLVLVWSTFMTSTATVAWSQVAQAVRQQRWLHGQTTFRDGKRGEIWICPEENLWAYALGDARMFFDGRQRAKFELTEKRDAIQILPLGEEEQSQVLPIRSLAQEAPTFSWLFGAEKVLHQKQRTVQDQGRSWIEFELKLARGELSHATLRVDPQTRLPVRLVLAAPNDSAPSIRWDFDYPASGPSDIDALGVDRDLPRVDLRPGAAAQRVVDATSASRKRIGDFQMLVTTTQKFAGAGELVQGYVVWRQGERWRVELCHLAPLRGKRWPTTPVEQSDNVTQWWAEQLRSCERTPLYVCDGKSVWYNRAVQPGAKAMWERSINVAPVDLLSGEGLGNLAYAAGIKFPSLLYPDLSRKSGWEFDFDAAPKDNPGLVVVKRSARLATKEPQTGHEWYYVDPSRGHAVVKIDLFTVSADQPADPETANVRQTITMKQLNESPKGVWYARSVETRQPISRGPGQPVTGHMDTVVRYDVMFDPAFEEGLFVAPPEQ